MRFILPPEGALRPNSAVDPLPYYYRPLVGHVFAARIETGLRLLDGLPRFHRLLEVGYGSGLLMPTLARRTEELWGVDLEPAPHELQGALVPLGATPKGLVQGDIRALPFADGFFDGVVAFSILEHLQPGDLASALSDVARVLQPGGHFLVACPAVHKAMNAAFSAIGFSGIEQHHFSSLRDVRRAARPYFDVVARASLPRFVPLPLGWAPYGALLLRRRDA